MNSEGAAWQDQLDRLLVYLKEKKQSLIGFVREKRDKYKLDSLQEPEPKEYELIVKTKVNPELLPTIDPELYTVKNEMYDEIEEGQNSMLEDLEREKENCLTREQAA